MVLTKNEKKILTTPARLGRVADKTEFKADFVFDDVRRWGPRQYWVRNGILEGVIDADLNFVIPPDRQTLRKTSFGFLRGKDDKLFIQGIFRLERDPYKIVTIHGLQTHPASLFMHNFIGILFQSGNSLNK